MVTPHTVCFSQCLYLSLKHKLDNSQDSDNYRGIALCVMCFKILEYVLLFKYEVYLSTSNLQFAYRENSSTTQCTWLSKEVIAHYNNKGSDVYSCLLDFSKAFDKLKYSDFFDRLLKRKVPPLVTRLIMHMYMNGSMCIRWGDATSEYFSASNSIKQGSVLSPILFSIYIDDLIERLLKNKEGCWVGNMFFGCIVYADDVELLVPCVRGLQFMLNVCNSFADENAIKTVCIKYHSKCHPQGPVKQFRVSLGGAKLKLFDCVKHLSHKLNCCLKSTHCIKYRREQFIGVVNPIQTEFSFAHPECKCQMLKIYGSSFYGSHYGTCIVLI